MSIETRPRILATGERVRLRTIGLRDIELLDAWRASAEFWSAFNDFGLQFPSLRKAVEEGRTIGEDGGNTLVELLDGTIIGTMSWHAVTYGPNLESRAWNIGITLAPAARGNGFGGEAQRLLADYLFTQTRANRIEAQTDVENVAEQRALGKAGFVREGVARGAQFRHGTWHDLVTFAITRGR
jgi:RimJ/RimL family protein N-acetyltransferase